MFTRPLYPHLPAVSTLIPSKPFAELYAGYKITKTLGKGSYGIVYGCEHEVTQKKVAIKIVNYVEQSTDTKKLFREISILRRLKEHPCIVSLEYVALEKNGDHDQIVMVFESCQFDLYQMIHGGTEWGIQHVQYFLWQLLDAIAYMHSLNLIHRDLKPSNILVNSDGSIKICDFGLARVINSLSKHTVYVVTRWYRSPEVILNGRAERPTDIWSIGCIFVELLTRRVLFKGPGGSVGQINVILDSIGALEKNDDEWIFYEANRHYVKQYRGLVLSQTLEQQFSFLPKPVLELLLSMLKFNPNKRISAENALTHPWFPRDFPSPDFSLDLKPEADIRLFNDYTTFEMGLDTDSPRSEAEIAQLAMAGIQAEVTQYRNSFAQTPVAAPEVASSAETSSVRASAVPRSFFYDDLSSRASHESGQNNVETNSSR